MTWKDEGQRVLAVRRADRARRVRAEAEAARLLAIADGLSVRDRGEREPAAALELRPVQIEQEVELDQLAGEVRAQLLGRVIEHGTARVGQPVRRPADVLQAVVRADEAQGADRS